MKVLKHPLLCTLCAAAPGVLLCLYLSYCNRFYELDDALIYSRYIENALNGIGLVFNAGEYYNALSSPLFSYLALFTCALTGEISQTMLLLSGAFLLLTVLVLPFLFSDIFSWPVLCFLSLAVASSHYFYSTFGLESTLFLFLTLLSLQLYRRESYLLLGISLALLVMTRGEGIILFGAIFALHLWNRKPLPEFRTFIPPTAILCIHATFQYFYYGSIFPGTLHAKMAQGLSGFWGTGPLFLKVDFLYGWYFGTALNGWFLGAAFLALPGFFYLFRNSAFRVLLLFLAGHLLFFSLCKIPAYHWYYAPYILTCYILVAAGVQVILMVPALTSRVSVRVLLTALISLFLLLPVSMQTNYSLTWMFKRENVYATIGTWLADNTPSNSVIAAVEVGALGWYSKRFIVDILGVTSPHNATYLARRKMAGWLKHYSPDYIVAHKPLWAQERAVLRLRARKRFIPVKELSVPGLIVLRKQPD